MKGNGFVLLVDDNVALIENLEEILGDEGLTVVVARSGAEALRHVDRADMRLVLTDMRMPGMSGVELIARLRELRPEVPVVMMTAYMGESATQQAQELDALRVLPKPVDFARLFELIDQVLEPDARILVLEDNAALRMNLVEALLDERRVLPLPASNLDEARRILNASAVDAAVLDIRLPDGDGRAVARELWAHGDHPVVFISGFEQSGDFGEARHTLMRKPFDLGGLVGTLQGFLSA